MATSAQPRNADTSIPKITCPQCGAQMTLARVEPDGPDDRERMFFDCLCGFEYRLSDQGHKAR
jgi:DNA-directed RNA polymerase subunit M/transcription elongation factor TFIIS